MGDHHSSHIPRHDFGLYVHSDPRYAHDGSRRLVDFAWFPISVRPGNYSYREPLYVVFPLNIMTSPDCILQMVCCPPLF